MVVAAVVVAVAGVVAAVFDSGGAVVTMDFERLYVEFFFFARLDVSVRRPGVVGTGWELRR